MTLPTSENRQRLVRVVKDEKSRILEHQAEEEPVFKN